MRSLIVKLFASVLIIASIVASPAAHAVDLFKNCDTKTVGTACNIVKEDKLNKDKGNNIWSIVSFILMVLGGIAVIMIIIGGIRYATSGGNQANVKAAKETIMYAVVGLVVALMASAIVAYIGQNFAN